MTAKDIARLQKEDSEKASTRKGGDDIMNFGNGMAPTASKDDEIPISKITSSTNPKKNVNAAVDELDNSTVKTNRSPLEIAELEIKQKKLSFEKKQILMVFEINITHTNTLGY